MFQLVEELAADNVCKKCTQKKAYVYKKCDE